jgi:hypothetical protein
MGIDVRSLEWMRPLLGEYAYNFQSLSELYAGNPASPGAWAEAIARSHAHPRNPAIAPILAAQQDRRGAPSDPTGSETLPAPGVSDRAPAPPRRR